MSGAEQRQYLIPNTKYPIPNYILSGAASRAKLRGEGTQYLSWEGTDRGPIPVPGGHRSRSRRFWTRPGTNPQRPPEQSPAADLASQKGNWQGPGRPPADPRATLNGILRKIRLAAPWYISNWPSPISVHQRRSLVAKKNKNYLLKMQIPTPVGTSLGDSFYEGYSSKIIYPRS